MYPNERRPNKEDSSPWLFKRALLVPRFRHMVDNWIQRGLSSMRSFPGFLVKLKSVLKFLRNEVNLAEICKCLERDGAPGLADLVR